MDQHRAKPDPERACPAAGGGPDLSPQCELMRGVYMLCHMMMRVVDRAVRPHGLTGSRWLLLVAVRDADEPPTITQLSECLLLSPQNVSRMVACLEAEGLVSRDTSGPGRTVRVGLTPTGAERVGACSPPADVCGREILDGIADEDLKRTAGVLDRAIRNTAELERRLTARGEPAGSDAESAQEEMV